jgi:hypothetical protein
MIGSTSPRTTRAAPRLAAVAALAVGIAASACETRVDAPSASVAPRPTATRDTAAVTLANILGPWRQKWVIIDDATVEIVRQACIAAADKDLSFGLIDQPAVLADARGLGLVSLILADDFSAFECRAKLAADGAAATAIEPPSRLDPASVKPLDEARITVVSHTRVKDATGERTIVIGRVGPAADAVGVEFNDETEVVAAIGNGWYLAWWPEPKEPGNIVSANRRNIVLKSVDDPVGVIQGRVAPATWWVDPSAVPIAAKATKVKAVLVERACAGGQSPKGRVLEPTIFSSETAVLVTLWVTRRPGDQDCPGNPEFKTTIAMSAPLGGRKLLDGGVIPPRDAMTAPR